MEGTNHDEEPQMTNDESEEVTPVNPDDAKDTRAKAAIGFNLAQQNLAKKRNQNNLLVGKLLN